MSRVADSISKTTARMRSRKLPESSSCTRNFSNCFSKEGDVCGASESPLAMEVEQRVAVTGERKGGFLKTLEGSEGKVEMAGTR